MQEAIERVNQKQFSSEFPYTYLNELVACPFHVGICPQWQKHGYCWAFPGLQSCKVGLDTAEAASGFSAGAPRMPFSSI